MASPFFSPRLRSWLETAPRGASKLGLTQLEDRTVPSSSIPLSGIGWKPIGGTIIPAAGTDAALQLPVAGRVTSIGTLAVPFLPNFNGVFSPTDPAFNTFYAGTPGGGVARTTDGGVTWTFLTDNLPDSTFLGSVANRNLQIGALGVSPLNPNLILAGTGEAGFPEVKQTDGLSDITYISNNRPLPPTTPPAPPNPPNPQPPFGPTGSLDLGGTGILRSTDGGATFTLIQGPGNAFVGNHFEKFVFHPTDPNIVFAVTDGGVIEDEPGNFVPKPSAVFRSLDAGVTWLSVSDNIPTPPPDQRTPGRLFNDLILDPTNPAVAFITISGGGIYRSANFLNTAGGTQPTPAQIVYTLVLGGTGTVTPGNSLQFTKMAFGLGTPDQPSRIYAVSASTFAVGPGDQLFRSDDSGINFRRLDPAPSFLTYNAVYNMEILPDPTSPNRVFFAGRGPNALQLLTNADFNPDLGQTPNYVTLPLPDNSNFRNLRNLQFDNTGAKDANGRALSPGRLLLATDAGLYRLQAVGGRPTLITDYITPAGNLELVSVNGAPGPNALSIQEFYSTALPPRSDNLVLGGTNSNGTARFVDNGPLPVGSTPYNNLFYQQPIVGAGTQGTSQDIVFSQIDPNLAYRVSNYSFENLESEGGLFQYSTDAGQTWITSINGILFPQTTRTGANTPLDFTISNKTAFIADPSPQIGSAEARLFLGTRVVNQSLDGGRNWAQFGPEVPFVTPARPGNPILFQPNISAIGRGLTSANTFRNRIYIAVDDRIGTYPGDMLPSNFGPAIYRYDRTPGDPQVWRNISPNTTSPLLPPSMGAPGFPQPNGLQGIVRQLLVDPTDENIVYAITSSLDVGRVLRTINGGTTWTDITANLPGFSAGGAPGIQIFSIALDPNRLTVTSDPLNPFTQSDDDIYLGTSVGIYRLSNPTNIGTPANPGYSRLAGTGTDERSATGNPIVAGSIPDVVVRDLDLNTTTGVLSAATFGRGMWQYQIRPFFRGQLIDDTTGNGVRDAADGVVVGGVVLAFDNGPTIPNQFANATTGPTGEYIFRSLPDSNYTFIPADTSAALIDPATRFFLSGSTINATVNETTTINGQDLFVFDRVDLSGVAYVDANGSGARDKGELPAAGFTVSLVAPGVGVIATQVTGADGRYLFRGLGPRRTPQGAPGQPNDPSFFVTTSKTNFQVTQQPAALAPLRSGVDITEFQPGLTQIGVFELGSIGGVVFEDRNADGVRGPGEQGLSGYVVGLAAPDGSFVANAVTDGNGAYRFDNVGAGNFRLLLNPQPGVASTTPAVITVPAQSGTVVSTANFGVFAAASLAGVTYDDTNGNGLRDPGEGTLGGLPVNLFVSTANGLAGVAATQSDANGNYSFVNIFASVGASTFVVRLGDAAGSAQSSNDASVSPVSGSQNAGLDIGVARAITVSGVAFEDTNGNGFQDAGEPGLAGGSVSLRNGQTNELLQTVGTDAGGNFLFNGVIPVRFGGTLRVTAPVTGFTQTTPPAEFVAFSGVPVNGVSIGLFRSSTFTGVAALDLNGDGVVDGGEPRLANRVVQLLDGAGNVVASTQTDGNGFYTLPSGPGSFRPFFPVSAGSVLTGPPLPLTPTRSGQTVADQNFTEFQIVAATGRVFNDLNADGSGNGDPGLPDILVQIFNASTGALVAQTRTDGDGNYTIPNLGGGSLRIQVVPPAPFPTPPSRTVSPTSGQGFNVDFGLVTNASVAGRVFRDQNFNASFESGDRPFPGRTVELRQNGTVLASTVTDANGGYSFGGLAPGSYTVVLVVDPQLTVSGSTSRDVTLTSGLTATQDFAVTPSARYALAADGGGGPRVQVYDALNGSLLQDFFVYEVSFTGGVRVATADVTGDGVDDLIVAPGRGGGPRIRVLDGVTQAVVYDYFAYEESFRNGLFVTAADVNGDGFADIITGTEAGGGPRVTVFDGKSGGIVADYFAYDENFRGGVRVGSGDVIGNGVASVLTTPGPGGPPNVIAWSIAGGVPTQQVNFSAFDGNYTGGTFVAASEGGLGGRSNIVVGSGQLQPDANVSVPAIRVFDSETGGAILEAEAFPGGVDPDGYRSEVRVASFDRTGDGLPDIALASGPGNYPRFRFLDPTNGRQIGNEQQPYEFGFTGGIFVG